MPMRTIHNGPTFRMDYNGMRETSFLLHKPSGRYVYMDRELTWKFRDAVGSVPSALFTDIETIYGWVWENAGFHRFAC